MTERVDNFVNLGESEGEVKDCEGSKCLMMAGAEIYSSEARDAGVMPVVTKVSLVRSFRKILDAS